MKVRNGFVSNSSSSSFLIYGAEIEMNDVIENFDTLKKEAIKSLENSRFSSRQEIANILKDVPDNLDSDEIIDTVESLDGLGEFLYDIEFETLTMEFGPGFDESVYLGLCPSKIGDNETGRQFKDKIEAEIKKFFPNKNNFGFHEECWRDG